MGSTASTLLPLTAIFLALTPQALAADGVDFSNNLFTDLAPVLALFGEQVAKQFMSQSLTWLEDVIFAMAPLGIITAMVSAVRVGGPNWLKAVVGRARESRATAEMELMSSTSNEVCELWNGEAIVRVMGSPEIAEILYFKDEADGRGEYMLFTPEAAKENGILRSTKGGKGCLTQAEPSQSTYTDKSPLAVYSVPIDADAAESAIVGSERIPRRERLRTQSTRPAPLSPPNISLNFRKDEKHRELWLFAILGIVLQFGSLVFIGVTRYHPKINLKEVKNSEYAYPLMASGTLVLVIGMMACSHVVQASSKEDMWVAKRSFRTLWLQKSGRVNDQHFDSYALFGKEKRNKFITSRRRACTGRAKHTFALAFSLSSLATAGSLVSIAGFVTQFVGIRALHWSASITQLIVTLTMTAVRTWIRRKMSRRPQAVMLPAGYEIDWLAVNFGTSLDKLWMPEAPHPEYDGPEGARDAAPNWEVITLHGYLGYEDARGAHTAPADMRDAQMILRLRMNLGRLTDWKGISYPFALELVECLQFLLSHFTVSDDIKLVDSFAQFETFRWALPVKINEKRQYITMTAKRSWREGGGWNPWYVDVFELCAVISLWYYRMKQRGLALEDTPDTHRTFWHHGAEAQTVLRVLGTATGEFIDDCRRWMDRGGKFVVVENDRLRNNTTEGQVTTIEAQELSEVTAHAGHGAPKSSRESIAPHRIMGAEPIDEGKCQKSLALVSMTPLRRIYAQEILASFLWAIVGTVRSIHGDTQPRCATPPRPDSKRESPFFQKLAEIITDSGVTSNLQDAYALIIPPFAATGKLPRQPLNGVTQDEIQPI